jgi:hypothetical protein
MNSYGPPMKRSDRPAVAVVNGLGSPIRADSNTGASTARSSPSRLSSHARSSTMTPAAAPLLSLVTNHELGVAVTRIKTTRGHTRIT